MTSPETILVLEDELALAEGIRDALELKGYQVHHCADGSGAAAAIDELKPDLLILDLMLPGKNGLDVLRELRSEGKSTRVLILSALASEDDLLMGFQLGADDYMKKPFSPKELMARVEAQFRRVRLDSSMPEMLELPGGIRVDMARLEVHRDEQVIALTPREADMLTYLIENRDRVVTRDDLLLDVWHYKSANVETRTVDIHIVGLRRKVEPDPANPTLIQTVRGRGYRWYN